jgi:DNA mismatch endonuclease, patch repair protein
MPDVFSQAKRSAVMALIKGKGNKDTELRLITLFRLNGVIGWRRGSKLLGRPDFVFSKLRLVVFVDGCFWHGCPAHFKMPTNNRSFWEKKIARNKTRDLAVTKILKQKGWTVLRVWEHDLRSPSNRLFRKIRRLSAFPSRLPSVKAVTFREAKK